MNRIAEVYLDVTSKSCPIPVLETRKVLEGMKSGQKLLVIVDYPLSKENIRRFVERDGHEIIKISQEDERFFIRIIKK